MFLDNFSNDAVRWIRFIAESCASSNAMYAHRISPGMAKARSRSSRRGTRKAMDMRVEDLRKKILHLDPYSGRFPAGATKRIMSIVDADLEPIGELETGSDGFVQLAVLVGRRFVRIAYYPGQPHATMTAITLDKASVARSAGR